MNARVAKCGKKGIKEREEINYSINKSFAGLKFFGSYLKVLYIEHNLLGENLVKFSNPYSIPALITPKRIIQKGSMINMQARIRAYSKFHLKIYIHSREINKARNIYFFFSFRNYQYLFIHQIYIKFFSSR